MHIGLPVQPQEIYMDFLREGKLKNLEDTGEVPFAGGWL
jgi:hypothetical protein